MNVLGFYNDRLEDIQFRGKTEKGLVLRRGKTARATVIADHKIIVTQLETDIQSGDIVLRVSSGERMLIIAKQYSADCTQFQGKRVNAEVEIERIVDVFENHKKVGTKADKKASNIPVFFQDISAGMKMYDAGLLPKTVKKIIMQDDTPVDILDRIVLHGRNYQVDNVDSAKYINLFEVQVSEDTRK